MSTRGYTVFGWLVWQLASRLAKYKIAQNRVKLGAAGIALGVLVAGVIAARSGSGSGD
jgi:hypothetical protein